MQIAAASRPPGPALLRFVRQRRERRPPTRSPPCAARPPSFHAPIPRPSSQNSTPSAAPLPPAAPVCSPAHLCMRPHHYHPHPSPLLPAPIAALAHATACHVPSPLPPFRTTVPRQSRPPERHCAHVSSPSPPGPPPAPLLVLPALLSAWASPHRHRPLSARSQATDKSSTAAMPLMEYVGEGSPYHEAFRQRIPVSELWWRLLEPYE